MRYAKLLAAAAGLALTAACAATPAPAVSTGAPDAASGAIAQPSKGEWAHQTSDIKPDPRVRFGRLPNGMRYALMKNATPAGEASLRLRFDVGSLMEREDQLGVAHFLEHMAFNGSKNVPEGEMIRLLQRQGLAFGADTNAYTGFDETVYMLELPETDDAVVDTGLMLMREAASELLFDAEAVNRERGVVLSEERTRDTPQLRVFRRQYDFLFKNQLLPKRFPIGAREVLQRVPREGFVEFYRAYYRPERATLVMVGDFDLDAMERKITARFSDWRAVGPAGAEPDLGAVSPRQVETRLMVEPGAPTSLQVAWLNPPDLRPDTRALRRERWTKALGFAVLNRRLERISRAVNPPFIAASASNDTNEDSAEVAALSVVAQPARWREALAAAEQEQRRIVEHGVGQAELAREIAEYRARLLAAVAGEATRRSEGLANRLVSAVDEDTVFSAPAEDLALFDAATTGLDAASVSVALRQAFAGQGPLVFMTSPTAIEGGETALAQAFTASRGMAVAPPAVLQAKAWPYENFGPAGRVVERREVADLQTTLVRFENGVRLTVKPTALRDDEILVSARIGDGRLEQARDRSNAAAWAASFAFTEGGLAALTRDELEAVLASRIAGASFGVDDDSFSLGGRTRPEDFAVQMQLLAAYVAAPGWRAEAFERLRAYGDTMHDELTSTPDGVFSRDGDALLRGGDRRWSTPSRAEIAAADPKGVRALLEPALSTDAVEITIVGDITVEEAIARTASTFGALPARRPSPAPAEARRIAFPTPTAVPVRLTHKGRADQALAFTAWPTRDFLADPQEARAVRLLEQVMQLRLTDEIREKQGVTYSPSTGFESSLVFPEYGYVSAAIEAPPDRLAPFFNDVRTIARQLRDTPLEADELERARRPRIEALEKARASNEYWLGSLSRIQTEPRRLDIVREAISGLEKVTAADVQRAARRYLDEGKAWSLTITPES